MKFWYLILLLSLLVACSGGDFSDTSQSEESVSEPEVIFSHDGESYEADVIRDGPDSLLATYQVSDFHNMELVMDFTQMQYSLSVNYLTDSGAVSSVGSAGNIPEPEDGVYTIEEDTPDGVFVATVVLE